MQQPFHRDLVSGLYQAADRMGYQLALSAVTPARDESRAVRSLLQDRCEALILLGPQVPTSSLADLAARLPVIVVARAVRHRAVDIVRTADDEGLHQAVDHLVAVGHRRISHIDGGRAPGAADRRRGYRQAMRRHGLDTEQMTTLAVARAVDRINGTPVAHRELVISPRLVVRGTTAAARPTPE